MLPVPASVREEARRGLRWRAEFGRGGIGPGQATARMLASGKLSLARLVKLRAYLARHAVDKKGKGFSENEPGFPSAGRIAWALWGGDAAQAWANDVLAAIRRAAGRS